MFQDSKIGLELKNVALMDTWICEKTAPLPPNKIVTSMDSWICKKMERIRRIFSPDTFFLVELGHVFNIQIQKLKVSRANKRSTLLENNRIVFNNSNLCNLARKS